MIMRLKSNEVTNIIERMNLIDLEISTLITDLKKFCESINGNEMTQLYEIVESCKDKSDRYDE